jgi:hypothetical protein
MPIPDGIVAKLGRTDALLTLFEPCRHMGNLENQFATVIDSLLIWISYLNCYPFVTVEGVIIHFCKISGGCYSCCTPSRPNQTTAASTWKSVEFLAIVIDTLRFSDQVAGPFIRSCLVKVLLLLCYRYSFNVKNFWFESHFFFFFFFFRKRRR